MTRCCRPDVAPGSARISFISACAASRLPAAAGARRPHLLGEQPVGTGPVGDPRDLGLGVDARGVQAHRLQGGQVAVFRIQPRTVRDVGHRACRILGAPGIGRGRRGRHLGQQLRRTVDLVRQHRDLLGLVEIGVQQQLARAASAA